MTDEHKEKLTDEHKAMMVEMIMNDYDIRPSLSRFIVRSITKDIEDIIWRDEQEDSPNTDLFAFNTKLRQICKYKGVFTEDLAKLLDVPIDTVASAVLGLKILHFSQLEKIAEYLGVPVDEFFDGSGKYK